ncbi:MAG: MlaD family protein [bacterium]
MRFAREIKVGIMIVFGIALLSVAIYVVGNYHLFERGRTYKVIFDYADGLELKAFVNVAGVLAGQVEGIRLINEMGKPTQAEITIWVREDAKIREDAKFYINTLGFVGKKYIEVSPGSPDAPFLESGATVKGVSPVQLNDLIAQGKIIADKVEEITDNVNRVIVDNAPELGNSMRDLQALIQKVNASIREEDLIALVQKASATMDDLQLAIRDVRGMVDKSREPIGRIISNVESASSQFGGIVQNVQSVTSDLNDITSKNKEKVGEIVDTLAVISHRLDSISSSVETLLKNVKMGEGLVGGLLVKDTPLNQDITATVKNIRRASGGVVELTEEARGRIEAILSDLEVISRDIREVTSRNKSNIDLIVGNLKEISRDINDVTSGNKGRINTIIANLESLSGRLNAIAAAIDSLLEDVRAGEGVVGGLIAHDAELGKDVKRTTKNLRQISKDYRERNLWDLLFGSRTREPKEGD